MPLYALRCECGTRFDAFSHRPEPRAVACPECGRDGCETDFQRTRFTLERRFAGSECESLLESFHPDEVPEARRLYPDTDIRDDGTVVWHRRSDITRFEARRRALYEAAANRGAEPAPNGPEEVAEPLLDDQPVVAGSAT